MILIKIGDRIRNLRLVRNMTQGKLIEGIASITYLSKVENNLTAPSEPFIRKIAARLHIEPDLLLQHAPEGLALKLEQIYEEYWNQDRLSEEDLSLIHLQVNEANDNRSFLMIYTTLIRYYYVGFRLQEAKNLMELSAKYIRGYDSSIRESYYFRYYFVCGKLLMDMHMLPQANEAFMRCESYREGASDRDLAKFYFSLSIVKQQLIEDKLVSLYYSEKSLDYHRKLGDQNRLAMVLFTRAIQFQLVSQPKDAINCLEEGRACIWDKDNVNLRAVLEYSIGRVYQAGKDYDQAIYYFTKALGFYQQSTFVEKSIQVHKRLIEIYSELKDWVLVEEHLQQAELLEKGNGRVTFYDIELEILRANTYKFLQEESRYEKAILIIIEQCKERGLFYSIKNLASDLATFFYQKCAFKKAANYYHLAYQAEQVQKNSSTQSFI